MRREYDVIVVGGGHAGCEAALAAARMGAQTLLVTHNIDTIGQMSCNPAIGGIGKSQLVKEIDAMGGAMARVIDRASIHVRILNQSKGPAVWSTRAQADRQLYKLHMRQTIERQPGLVVFQQAVDDIILDNGRCVGIVTQMGLTLHAKAVVLTAGTFLNGLIHIGDKTIPAGRAGDPASNRLAQMLRDQVFTVDRLKTGTPPRIDSATIRYDVLEEQPSELDVPLFSALSRPGDRPKTLPCYITQTCARTHEIIRNNIARSPLYNGKIDGVGPRYCPSIEDKVYRFDRDHHPVFVEPEGLCVHEVYPNGISTSLPFDVQCQVVQSIKGFEQAQITRPGYAIEYDFFDPRGLRPWLETQAVSGLFFAGQINGTTGYEEAGAQGLIAGLNAGRLSQGLPTWYPQRHEAYMGVLIDDLVTQGTKEPYRMFTSRAEHRLSLREDNADCRLTPVAHEMGLVTDEQWQVYLKKQERLQKAKAYLAACTIQPGSDQAMLYERLTGAAVTKVTKADALLARPEINTDVLVALVGGEKDDVMLATLLAEGKYAGYMQRQAKDIADLAKTEAVVIPADIAYEDIGGLSAEMVEKLKATSPHTLGQASRIQGITPAALSILMVYVKQRDRSR